VLSGRNLRDELITRPEESYRLCCVVVCDLETSRIGAPYIYEISNLRIKYSQHLIKDPEIVSGKKSYTILISQKIASGKGGGECPTKTQRGFRGCPHLSLK
jgi:hypothetical protein